MKHHLTAILTLLLALLLFCSAAQAVTTPSDITTGTDITTDTDIPGPPNPPSQPETPDASGLKITGAASVRGGQKVTLKATLNGESISASLLDWAVYPYNEDLCTISKGVVTTRRVTCRQSVQVTAVLKSNPTVYADFTLSIHPTMTKLSILAPSTYIDLNGSSTMQLQAFTEPGDASQDIRWTSSSTSRATVDESGLVTAHKEGAVTITAKATDGSGLSAKVTLQIVRGVTGVSITGPSSVAEGKSITLKAIVTPENATIDDVIWSVDCDRSIATISRGKLTAKNVEENTTVIVTAASKQNPAITATHAVTICPSASKVSISAPAAIIDLDSENPTLQLTAAVMPADASQEIAWSSSSTSRATVDENGLVTAKRTGTVTITAKATDGSGKKASITIKIVRAVKSVSISGSSSVAAGKSILLKASILPENATNDDVTWSVDCDKSIATINSEGRLTAKSGVAALTTVTVTCRSRENADIFDAHQVTIRPVAGKITITAPQTFIDLGAESPTLQLTAAVTPADASQEIAWSSSSTSRATVDENGLVTAKRTGSVTITAKATDGSGRTAKITLQIVHAVKGLSITGSTEVGSGRSITLKAIVEPSGATNKNVSWSVDCAKTVATISSSGTLTARSGITSPVTVTVTCVSKENAAVFATHQVTIRPAVSKITIAAPQTFIDLDSENPTLQLTASCTPELSSQQVTWSSSSSRATVDENGLVTAHRLGTVTITARAKDGTGRKASITIKIVNAAKRLEITGATEVAGGYSIRLKAVITPENATNRNVLWSVDCDSSIATITTSGRLYARKVTEPMTVTVTCVSKENSAIHDTHEVSIRPAVGRISIYAPRTWIDVTSETPTLKLSASCTPDAAGQGVTWSTSSSKVATVNASGLVTGHAVGTATITAKANDGSGRYASITVRVIKPITEITIAGNKTVYGGRTLRLRYAVSPADATSKRLTWSVNCPSTIATVANGVVSAKPVTEPTLIIVTAASADNPAVKAEFPVLILP